MALNVFYPLEWVFFKITGIPQGYPRKSVFAYQVPVKRHSEVSKEKLDHNKLQKTREFLSSLSKNELNALAIDYWNKKK